MCEQRGQKALLSGREALGEQRVASLAGHPELGFSPFVRSAIPSPSKFWAIGVCVWRGTSRAA